MNASTEVLDLLKFEPTRSHRRERLGTSTMPEDTPDRVSRACNAEQHARTRHRQRPNNMPIPFKNARAHHAEQQARTLRWQHPSSMPTICQAPNSFNLITMPGLTTTGLQW